MIEPRETMEKAFGAYLLPGKSYPEPLPEDLARWYCYTRDGGHSIAVVTEQHYAPGIDPGDYLVPAPVRSVLRAGHRVSPEGLVVSELPYSSETGLMTPEGDDEHEGSPSGPESSGTGGFALAGQVFEVGKRYPGEGWGFPMAGEAVQYNFDVAGHVLQLFWPGVSGSETKAVRRGAASFALAVEGPAIFLCYRFGDMPWSDTPFTVHLLPEERRLASSVSADPEGRGPNNVLSVHLVDGRSGVLRALRGLGLPREFTDAFEVALQEQLAAGWERRAEYYAALAGVYRRYPSSYALATGDAAVARADFPSSERGGGSFARRKK